MSEDIATVLGQTAARILEELVFLFTTPVDDPEAKQTDAMTATKVTFTGPLSGTLVMRLSNRVLPELTANMLGLDNHDDITLEDQLGSLTETLNIICGNFLPELAGKKEVFDIGQPMVITENDVSDFHNGNMTISHVILGLEEGLCRLDLFINSWMD